MSKISLSSSVCLVVEMIKVCLLQTEPEHGLHGRWLQIDIDTDVNPSDHKYDDEMRVTILIGKFKYPYVTATCKGKVTEVFCPKLDIEICVSDRRNGRPYDDPYWRFNCELPSTGTFVVNRIK